MQSETHAICNNFFKLICLFCPVDNANKWTLERQVEKKARNKWAPVLVETVLENKQTAFAQFVEAVFVGSLVPTNGH